MLMRADPKRSAHSRRCSGDLPGNRGEAPLVRRSLANRILEERPCQPWRPLRVLLAEDDALIGMLLAEMSEALGHSVCASASTEADAITGAARQRPDFAIFSTSNSPKGNGVSAVREIFRASPIPHFFITGRGIDAVTSDAIVLQKPFREADLIRAIDLAIRQRRLSIRQLAQYSAADLSIFSEPAAPCPLGPIYRSADP